MEIGFIGLGTMGGSIAYNMIKAGLHLTVNDVRRQVAARHLEAGAAWGATACQVAEASDIVFTSLPGPVEVEAVALGKDGILEGIRPGKVYIDLSTNSPTVVRRIHAAFSKKGAHMLDGPVSGGPKGARDKKLAVWAGGDREVFQRCLPALETFADKPYYVGPIGTGAVAKLVHNCAGYIAMFGMAEVFTMGVKAGVEPLALYQAVRQGAVGRRAFFDHVATHLLPGHFDPPDFALKLARKDVDLAVGVGREFDVPMRMASLALQEMTEAMNRGWGDRDSRVAMQLQEERAGVQVRASEEALKKAQESG